MEKYPSIAKSAFLAQLRADDVSGAIFAQWRDTYSNDINWDIFELHGRQTLSLETAFAKASGTNTFSAVDGILRKAYQSAFLAIYPGERVTNGEAPIYPEGHYAKIARGYWIANASVQGIALEWPMLANSLRWAWVAFAKTARSGGSGFAAWKAYVDVTDGDKHELSATAQDIIDKVVTFMQTWVPAPDAKRDRLGESAYKAAAEELNQKEKARAWAELEPKLAESWRDFACAAQGHQ